MHIGEKILQDIQNALEDKYSIYISQDDWKLFKKPLLFDKNGEINRPTFEERQNKSVDIIKQILDIHGKADIVKFLGCLASIEPRIQELQPRVRDHVVHAVNTFILGVYILEKVIFPPFKGSRFDYPFMWKLCGPTHDLGYPIEIAHNIKLSFANEVNDVLKSLNSPSPRVDPELYPENLDKLCGNYDASEIIQKRLTEWALGIDIEKYYDWLRKKNRTDHGVVSALAQLKVIDALYYKINPNKAYRDINQNGLNYNQKNFDLDIVSASSALFIHNIDLNYYGFSNKIAFNITPLAFLLFLCDTFQEWDRYSENKNRPVHSGDDFDINCSHNSISLFVPEELEQKVFAALYQRLSGLLVRVNGRIAVS
jgi:hypothetical protein